MTNTFRHGDYKMISDRTGFEMYASEARREWTGLIVHKREHEERHPQDFVHGVMDRQSVEVARPEPLPVYIGPLTTETTADVAAGQTTLPVVSSDRFVDGDTLNVSLDNGDLHRPTVYNVPTATSLEIVNPLPGAIGSGRKIINVSAIASSDVTTARTW